MGFTKQSHRGLCSFNGSFSQNSLKGRGSGELPEQLEGGRGKGREAIPSSKLAMLVQTDLSSQSDVEPSPRAANSTKLEHVNF